MLKRLASSLMGWLTRPAPPQPRRLDISILEDRILYSATAMPLPDATAFDPTSMDIDSVESALNDAFSDPHGFEQLRAVYEALLHEQNAALVSNTISDQVSNIVSEQKSSALILVRYHSEMSPAGTTQVADSGTSTQRQTMRLKRRISSQMLRRSLT